MIDKSDLLAVSLARRAAVGGNAKQLREARGLGLREVAAVVGCDPASISRYERGAARPSGDQAIRYGQVIASWLEAETVEDAAAEETPHEHGCRCVRCQCRRWLSWRPLEDRPLAVATLQVQSFDGRRSGRVGDDRAYDVVVREADMLRALRAAEPFLGLVGQVSRRTRAGQVVAWLEGRKTADLPGAEPWVKRRWAEAKDAHPVRTLGWVLDQAAEAMAAQLGDMPRD